MRRQPLPRRSGVRALVAALACTVSTAWAEEATEEPSANALWVNLGALTHHPNRDNGYNESNGGLGMEYRFRPDASVMLGTFRNSLYRDTNYAAVNWQPLSLGNWKLGLAVGVMNGYPGVENGGYFLAALPMASYEGKRFGVNFSVIPNVAKIDGALIVQVKFRLF